VVNYPPRNAYTPRFTAAWLYDQSNRENYQELAQLTFEWSQVIEADTAESLIGSIDWDNAQAAPDSTVMQFVQATAPMRERLLEFTATRALTPALSPSMGYHRDFDAHYLESAHQLELLAAAEELRHGRRAAATARFMRLLAGTVRLADTGTPAAVWAANTCLAVDARLLPELFPLSGQGGNPRLAGQVLRHLAAFETAARSSTVRVIEVQSMNLDYFCRELQKSVFNGGVYPFGNAAKQCAYYEKMYAGMMARSYRPYYENPYTYWSKPEFTIADYCLRPWNVATEVDVNYDFGRGEQAVAIDLSRLMRIQIYLSLYRQATGKLPDSLEALWRHFAVAPLTSELTGTPFPYPGIVDGQCVLFTWAEKTLASMARSYLFADRQNESAERIVLQ
ncbi:MAG TPA: hypothetical protein PKM88_10295, partial [bacterium]|nr:hypothetical protein [bacterium]